jgi:membrane fusion protein, multidrug efflux system
MTSAIKPASSARPDAAPNATAPAAASPKDGPRRIILPILLVLVLLGGVWALKQWSYGRTHESTENATVDGDLVPVLAKVSGYVETVAVADNQPIAASALIAQIDPAEYRVRLALAEADLAAARAGSGESGVSGQAQAAVETATGQRSSLDAQVDAARANEVKARADLARMEELVGKQIVSRQQLDAAQATADAATANLIAVQRQAAAAGGSIAGAEAGVRLARARLQAAQAAVDNARLQLDYTRIVAPAAGIVARKQIERGQLVQAGQPLLTIVSDSGVWITANFKETQLSDLRVGQQVEFEVDAYAGAVAQGRIESVSAATGSKFALLPPDNATGNFTKVVQRVPVRIVITRDLGKDRPLRPGMSVAVHVTTK